MSGPLREGTANGLTVLAISVSFVTSCLAYLLLLPPFEGFDEVAHYSYISQLADRGEIPDLRRSRLDSTLQQDARGLPRPYSPLPPFEQNGGLTYASYFELPIESRRQAIDGFWLPPDSPAAFSPETRTNWQGQHPPLYYAIMTIPYVLTRSASPAVRWLVLRLVSAGIAATSLLFWWKASRLPESSASQYMILSTGLVVLFFPSCWFDLARLGNDGLLAVWTTAAVYLLLRVCRDRQQSLSNFVAIGVVSGLGLLTKGFFIPLFAGILLFIAWHGVSCCRLEAHRLASRLLLVILVAGVFAGPWFAFCQHRYGTPLPTDETFTYASRTDFPGDSLSFFGRCFAMVRAMSAFLATFSWCGGWSWIKRPTWHYPMMAPLLCLAVVNSRQAWRQSNPEMRCIGMATVFLFLPFLASFVWYMYLRIRWTGIGSGVGGYYLFAAWPLVGLALWQVFLPADTRLRMVWLFLALASAILFEIAGLWFFMQIGAGIATKTGDVSFAAGARWPTFENLCLVFTRLRELVFPAWALVFFVIAMIAKVIAAGRVIRWDAVGRSVSCEPTALAMPEEVLVGDGVD